MNIEKMREEFEAWRLRNFCGGAERLKKCSNAPEIYYYTAEQEAWKVWQASRADLVVELPELSECIDIAYFRAGVMDAIEAAGVRVKP